MPSPYQAIDTVLGVSRADTKFLAGKVRVDDRLPLKHVE